MKMPLGISRPSSLVPIFFSLVVMSCCLFDAEGGTCQPSGSSRGKKPPPGKCNNENNPDCCKQGKLYPIFHCSPPVTKRTKANLTLNSFARGGGGGGASECDNKIHSDDTPECDGVYFQKHYYV